MIKLDSSSLPLILPAASSMDAGSVRRLMVLIPGVETDHTRVIHRIWELAHALGCGVLFLGLCREAWEEPGLRRDLVTMSASVQDGWIPTEVKTGIGNDWLKLVKSSREEGDLIVCLSDHRAGLAQKPLGQILESKLNTTVYFLPGFDSPHRRGMSLLSAFVLWIGFAVTVIGFFFLQVTLAQALTGWVQTLLISLTVLVEFWLIRAWSSLFG